MAQIYGLLTKGHKKCPLVNYSKGHKGYKITNFIKSSLSKGLLLGRNTNSTIYSKDKPVDKIN
ncbi:MAG: hypothetical protein ACI976_002603 [Aureispira sp.]|jgi:hypothetical protein